MEVISGNKPVLCRLFTGKWQKVANTFTCTTPGLVRYLSPFTYLRTRHRRGKVKVFDVCPTDYHDCSLCLQAVPKTTHDGVLVSHGLLLCSGYDFFPRCAKYVGLVVEKKHRDQHVNLYQAKQIVLG